MTNEENDFEVLEEIKQLSIEELMISIKEWADIIVQNTQGESWDDPEEWESEAALLAHAVYRMNREGLL